MNTNDQNKTNVIGGVSCFKKGRVNKHYFYKSNFKRKLSVGYRPHDFPLEWPQHVNSPTPFMMGQAVLLEKRMTQTVLPSDKPN